VVRGLGWKLISQSSLQISRLAVGIVLARLLSPHDFGLAAMALVVSSFIIPFADLGFGAAIVQRRSISEDDRSTAFWTSVGAGALLTGGMIAVSPLIGAFYRSHRVGPLVAVISCSFVITALGSTHRSLLVRSMNFRSLELRYIAASMASGIAAVVVAARGFGPWAFVIQEIVLAVISTALLWLVVPWRPRFRFSAASARDLGGFGARALGGAFFLALNRNTDNILIGRFLGSAPLGLYSFAYNLMLSPISRLVSPLQQVAFPAFSRLQDDERRLGRSWLRANRLVAATCVPLLLGVALTARDAVPLVFGERWQPAVTVLRILCVVGMLQCLQAMNDSILQAANAVKLYLRFTAASFALNGAAFVVGLHWGLIGVASAFAASSAFLAVAYAVLVARRLGVDGRAFLSTFRGVAEAIVATFAAVLVEWLAVPGGPGHRLVHVGGAVALALPLYALFFGWRAPEILSELRSFARSRRATPSVAAASVPAGTAT
jgi:polysaccharide transporter, PST family